MKEKRKNLRNELWTKQDVLLRRHINDQMYNNEKIRCKLENISSKGMFVSTEKKIELGRQVSFSIEFKSISRIGPLLHGKGVVSRSHSNGLAIRFVDFDMNKFQECVFWMIDHA
jgi:hypothetical protein